MKNIKNKKINLYIGLTTNKNKKLNLKNTLKVISNIFIKYKINGFSVNRIFGFWNNKEEKTLIISFINVYKLDYLKLIVIINKLKGDLKQDSILLEILNIPFEFI